jgi:phenylpyruvate tautomerase PptA (4-oxalocrotonate tautomerase family)
MTRLTPEQLDHYKRESERIRNVAISEFWQHIYQLPRRFADYLAGKAQSAYFALGAIARHTASNKPRNPKPYLHLVIGRQIDPAMRLLTARHTDAMLSSLLGLKPGSTTIRIDGTPSEHWFPASQADSGGRPTTIHAELQIGAGCMSRAQKMQMIDDLYTFFQEAFGALAGTSRIVIREVHAHDCFPYQLTSSA